MSFAQYDVARQQAAKLTIDEAVTTALDDQKDPLYRVAAASFVLNSELPNDFKATYLNSFLTVASVDVRRAAIGYCDVNSSLAELVRESIWEIASARDENAQYALRCLATLKDDRVLDACKNMYHHGSRDERVAAVTILGFLGTEAAGQVLSDWYEQDRRVGRVHFIYALTRCARAVDTSVVESRLRRNRILAHIPYIGRYLRWMVVSDAVVLARNDVQAGRDEIARILRGGNADEERVVTMFMESMSS